MTEKKEVTMLSLEIDPLRQKRYREVGCFFRAYDDQGRIQTADIMHLTKESILAIMRDREVNEYGRGVILTIMGFEE